MIATVIACLQIAACVGYGAAVLRVLNLHPAKDAFGNSVWSFAIGFGVLGWLLYFIGTFDLFAPPPLAGVLGAGVFGLYFLLSGGGGVSEGHARHQFTWIDGLIICTLAVVLAFDLMEAISPPADADTLAYHFALPKQFIEQGGIKFVPRAADGAIPLLIQMTYVPALALGGEMALTLWTTISGWGAAAMLFVFARKYLDVTWSLALALLFLTTPAVLFGGGTGQVEIRMALFLAAGVLSMLLGIHENNIRYIILAAIFTGFVTASKFTGLLFAASFLPVIAYRSKSIKTLLIFGGVAFLVGCQWYYWNWLHTGDPIFPLLYDLVDYTDPSYWDAAHRDQFGKMFVVERVVPRNLLWLVSYPVIATLAGLEEFESARTGFGPLPLLLLPFALGAMWKFRNRVLSSGLFDVAVMITISYLLWFFIGSSQKVRHFLPIYPLILILLTAASHEWAKSLRVQPVLAAALILTGLIQIAGQGVF